MASSQKINGLDLLHPPSCESRASRRSRPNFPNSARRSKGLAILETSIEGEHLVDRPLWRISSDQVDVRAATRRDVYRITGLLPRFEGLRVGSYQGQQRRASDVQRPFPAHRVDHAATMLQQRISPVIVLPERAPASPNRCTPSSASSCPRRRSSSYIAQLHHALAQWGATNLGRCFPPASMQIGLRARRPPSELGASWHRPRRQPIRRRRGPSIPAA